MPWTNKYPTFDLWCIARRAQYVTILTKTAFSESSKSRAPMQGSKARRARRILERTAPRRPPSSRGWTGRRRRPPPPPQAPPRCQRPPNPAARGRGAATGRRCCQVYLCDNLMRIEVKFLMGQIFHCRSILIKRFLILLHILVLHSQ